MDTKPQIRQIITQDQIRCDAAVQFRGSSPASNSDALVNDQAYKDPALSAKMQRQSIHFSPSVQRIEEESNLQIPDQQSRSSLEYLFQANCLNSHRIPERTFLPTIPKIQMQMNQFSDDV